MVTAVFSLLGAFVFGAADFLGGLAAKRVSSVLATAVAALTGFVLLAAAAPFLGGDWIRHDVFWGVVSGITGAVAISLLYACLAIGPMSILSPLTAVVSAVVPMVWGLVVGGERLAALGYWALGLALVAVVLVGFVPERGAVRPSLRGILMAIGSGIAIGTFFVTIDQTSEQSGAVPLLLNRAVTATILFAAVGVLALVAAGRGRRGPARGSAAASVVGGSDAAVAVPSEHRGNERMLQAAPVGTAVAPSRSTTAAGVRLAIACGAVDVTANGLLLIGIRAGDLSVAAVLGAMYPAGTILLAAIVLKERIAPVQWAGLVLALVAAGMLALS
jgi:drug/metabolite transporter (DMT)-like permease